MSGQRKIFKNKRILWITHPYLPKFWDMIACEISSPKVVVELGSNVGRWCHEILIRFPTIERFYAVDVWLDVESFEGWKQNVNDPRAIPLRGKTDVMSNKVNESVDILYVDACHEYKAAYRDLLTWTPKVRPGGLIILDDYNDWRVKEAVKRFLHKINRRGVGSSGVFGGDLKDTNKQFWVTKDW